MVKQPRTDDMRSLKKEAFKDVFLAGLVATNVHQRLNETATIYLPFS